jgi:hypothetical protein
MTELTGGAHASAAEGVSQRNSSGGAMLGRGQNGLWAESFPLALFSSYSFSFSFSFFCILICFKLLQICFKSNKFLNSCNIHSNGLNQ